MIKSIQSWLDLHNLDLEMHREHNIISGLNWDLHFHFSPHCHSYQLLPAVHHQVERKVLPDKLSLISAFVCLNASDGTSCKFILWGTMKLSCSRKDISTWIRFSPKSSSTRFVSLLKASASMLLILQYWTKIFCRFVIPNWKEFI